MKFREWFHKIGGDQNFTEEQISIAVTNKFKIKTMIHNIKQLVTIIVFLSLLVAVLMYGDMR
jgi:hypothetical protein